MGQKEGGTEGGQKKGRRRGVEGWALQQPHDTPPRARTALPWNPLPTLSCS